MSADFAWHDHHFLTGVAGLDFANTIAWRDDPARRQDRIRSRQDLRGWLKAAKLRPGKIELAASLKARRAIDRYFRDTNEAAWAELISRYARTLAGDPKDSLSFILHSAVALAFSRDAARVKICGNCGWLFIDRTRNRNKRWCTAGLCGARTRSRRYYARRKASS